MSPPVTLAVLVERIDNLRVDLAEKHKQNRGDIHKLENEIQTLTNQIWLIKLKLAGFSAVGAGTGVGLVELIKYLHSILK